MAENLRKSPYQANVIVAGYDIDGPKLYWMDYLGSSCKVTKAAHGYGSNFLYGIMDNFYRSVIF
jgi:20S proteasome subunit beta 4